MPTINIPQRSKEDDLVSIPRKEYEEFTKWRVVMRSFKVFTPTAAQKKELATAREDYKRGKFITLDELKRKLEIKNTR